jgi:hypothetical protein
MFNRITKGHACHVNQLLVFSHAEASLANDMYLWTDRKGREFPAEAWLKEYD